MISPLLLCGPVYVCVLIKETWRDVMMNERKVNDRANQIKKKEKPFA